MRWSSSSFEEFKRLIPDFVWYGCFVAVLALLVFSHLILVPRFPAFRPLLWVAVGTILGVAVALIISRGRREHWIYRTLDPVPTSPKAMTWWSIGIVVAVGVTCLDVDWSHVREMLDHHGSFFDWIIGSLTVVGIWLTYNTITESQRIIRSFPQLQSRMIALADDTEANKSAGDLRYLAYTGSIGFLALKNEEWPRLQGAFTKLGDRLRVICLDDQELTQWHNQYIGRATSRLPVDGGKALALTDTLEATSESIHLMSLHLRHCRKAKCEMLPGYYLFFNDRRAIIVTPFFVPHHALAINDPAGQQYTNRVQMFGFETTDQRIIEDAAVLFEYYWKNEHRRLRHFDSQGGDLPSVRASMANKFDEWASKCAHDGTYYRYRLLVVEEKPWEMILGDLENKVGEAAFQKYLSKSTAHAESDRLSILVENQQQKDWIELNCRQHIEVARTGMGLDIPIEIAVAPVPAAVVAP